MSTTLVMSQINPLKFQLVIYCYNICEFEIYTIYIYTDDSRNTPSTTNLEKEEIVEAPGNDGNASMPAQVKGPNPWREMMMMMMMMISG
jgi:hypothetical protein